MKIIIPFLSLLLIGQSLLAQAPPVLRSIWTTNFPGTPIPGGIILNGTNIGIWTVNDTNDTLRIGTNVNTLKGSGNRNTFIGSHIAHRYKLNTNSADGAFGADNVGIGAFVMESLTNAPSSFGAGGAYRNVVIGSKAGLSISNAYSNILIGFRSGTSIESGANNTAVGEGTFMNCSGTNLVGNTSIGSESLLCATNDSLYNTAVGFHAAYGRFGAGLFTPTFVAPGQFNTYIGAFAGGEMRTNNVGHSNTVALGFSAGYSGGTHCTYIGYRAGQNNTNDNDTVIIDGRDRFTYALEQTDSLLYGRLSNNIPDQTLRINAGDVTVRAGAVGVGRFGVATTNFPNTALSVNGSALFRDTSTGDKGMRIERATEASGYQLQNTEGGRNFYRAFNHVFSTESSNELARLTSTGFGIGNIPAAKLDVEGSTILRGTLGVSGVTTATNRIDALGNIYVNGSNGVANASVGGTLTNSIGPIVNAGTAETNMITVNLPAHLLTNLNDRVEFRAAIRFAATADNKAFTATYGSEAIYSSGTVAQSGGDAVITGEIIRTGNTSQSCNVAFSGNGAFDGASTFETAQTNGIATILKITATAAASGVLTNRSLVVKYYPAR